MNLIFVFVIVCFLLNLNAPADVSSANKLLLCTEFIGVLVTGKLIVDSLLKILSYQFRKKMYGAFLGFFAICLLYLYVCWTPYLSPNGNADWGFDPQRYYEYASSIIQGDGIDFTLNYMGIVSVYTVLMGIFGIDPLVPLYINVILVLVVVCILTKTLYLQYGKTGVYRYAYLFMFLPEVIFYSCISSREIFCMVLVTLCCNIAATKDIKSTKNIISLILLIIATFYIRPHFAFAAIAAILLASIRNKAYASIGMIVIFLVAVAVFGDLETSSESMVGMEDMSQKFSDKIEGENEASENFNYNTNSLARALIPSNPVQFVVFGFIRSLLYLIPRSSPISVLSTAFDRPYYFSLVFAWISSFIIMLSIPALLYFFKKGTKKDSLFRSYFIYFVFFLLFIGMLNTTLIQERYRLVYDLCWMMTWLLALQYKKNKEIERYKYSRKL